MSDMHLHAPDCQCCAGVDAATPGRIDNPPGRPAIAYRIGRHAEFLESIRARLSSSAYPALAPLTTREPSDFTLALADALAGTLDVLTFYTERFANEHYLRTATERLSVLEMARLIGYELGPGVAAGTYLAFRLSDIPGARTEAITIPVGTRVQSVPGQGEKAQTFETVSPAPARAGWNAMPVQTSTPWRPKTGDTELWLDGVATHLQTGDAILIVGADRINHPGSEHWDVRVLAGVEADADNGRTRVRWSRPLGSTYPAMSPAGSGVQVHALRQRGALFGHNAPDPNLLGKPSDNTSATSNIGNLVEKDPKNHILARWQNFEIKPPYIDIDSENAKIVSNSWVALVSNDTGYGGADLPGYVELYKASTVTHCSRSDFGLSGKITRVHADSPPGSKPEHLNASYFDLRQTLVLAQSEQLDTIDTPLFHPVYGDAVDLGLRVDDLRPGQAMALTGPRQRIAIAPGVKGLSLSLDEGGSTALAEGDELFMLEPAVRMDGSSPQAISAKAFAAQIGLAYVQLKLRLEDRDGRTGTLTANGSEIRLAASRKDDPKVSEIVFIAATADAVVPERDRTRLKLQAPTRNVYERAGLRLNANVAPATHGETVEAILGDGDGSTPNQRFRLGQEPLTYVSAKTPSGRASTLQVRINDVLWTEVPTLYQAPANAHSYETWRDDKAYTTVQFGDGLEGTRLPSGSANVRAHYRKGLGTGGNVAAGKLTTLLSRPLGVGEVTNPEPATGGENAERLDRARENAPLTVLTLGRAVSIADYADFSRAFAGIDKAHALWIPAGPGRGVFLTIAGVDGAEVPKSSDTFKNLHDALTDFGDPLIPIHIKNFTDARFRCRLAVKVLATYEPDPVRKAIEAALRLHFGFAHRRFGQMVSADELAAVAQHVDGVEAVQVTRLYRDGKAPASKARLFAALPVASLTALPMAAELLTLSDGPLELEVLA